ncbi:MAG TPA: T9SS type A sorting domain-containing protein [Bacteroidetes bacterium]|nr:T9SS type A sorting domain-containing protein [Bacteroidota bacterium]
MNSISIRYSILFLLILIQVPRIYITAQSINSINISPQNPTKQDSILIMVNCTFSSSSCDSSLDYLSVNNNIIYASTTHCIGMLPTTCDATDTFVVSGLPAGSYTFMYKVNQGYLPSCTPGIVPGPTDSLTFNVSASTDIPLITQDNDLVIYPSISTGTIFLKSSKGLNNADFTIYSIHGMEVFNTKINGNKVRINLDIEPGVYCYAIKNKGKALGVNKLFIKAK